MPNTFIDLYNKMKNEIRDEIVEIQKNLVSIKALAPENGGDGETEKNQYIKQHLKNFSGTFTDYPIKDERVSAGFRPNTTFVIPGTDSTRTLWLVSHTDVVPEGDRSLWESEPFALRVDDDILIGRGVQDNHSSIVSAMLTARLIAKSGKTPPVNFGAAFFADEEMGSTLGIAAVMDEYEVFSKNDIIYVPDMNTPEGNVIEIAEKSCVWIEITIHGSQCHGSRPDIGTNAHRAGIYFAMEIEALRKNKYGAKNDLYDYPLSSIEPTKVDKNVGNINTIPGEHRMAYDCRILPEYDIDKLRADFETAGKKIEKEFGVRISFAYPNIIRALPQTDTNCPALRYMKTALKNALGKEMILKGVGGSTCAYYIRKHGINAVVSGLGPHSAHMPNEYISITDIASAVKLNAAILDAIDIGL